MSDRADMRKNVIRFVDDMISYILSRVGLGWASPGTLSPGSTEFFWDEFGDDVLRYRNANDEVFRGIVREVPRKLLLDPGNVSNFFIKVVSRCFDHDQDVLETFFIICAFLVDLSIFCYRYGRQDLILRAVGTIRFVYDQYLEWEFEKKDVWHRLRCAAKKRVPCVWCREFSCFTKNAECLPSLKQTAF